MKIAIRMDDITPDMDWEKFLAFKDILDRNGLKPLIGVVPDNQDENLHRAKPAADFWEYIKELQESGWSVALHGYKHLYTTVKGGCFPLNHFAEFAGVPLDQQRQMLKSADEILKRNAIETDLFMAPAHAYDKNTLKALKELGYTKITDGFGKGPYLWQSMTFYPISFKLSDSLKRKKGYTTMVVHVNTFSDEDMKRYEKMIESHKEQFISYEGYLEEPAKNRGFWGHLWENILARAKHNLVRLKG